MTDWWTWQKSPGTEGVHEVVFLEGRDLRDRDAENQGSHVRFQDGFWKARFRCRSLRGVVG